MNLLKKITITLFIGVLATGLIGCGKKVEKVEGSLEELMTKVYENIPEEERPMMLTNIEITRETSGGYLGTSDIDFVEALASEPAIGSIAHSVVLLRVKADADIEEIKKQIEDNVNPRKWICVEAEKVVVKSKGDLIILIMSSNDTVETIEASFDNL